MKEIIYDIETYAENEGDIVDKYGKYTPFPLAEKIIVISTFDLSTGEQKSFYGEDEKKILEDFWNYIHSDNEVMLIGFSNESYDDRYLKTRSLVHGIEIERFNSLDLRKVFSGGDIYAKGKLSDFGEALGIEIKTENGNSMRGFYESKNWDKIKGHCEEDVSITIRLFKRCKECQIL